MHNNGVSHQLNWARDELGTVSRLVTGLDGVPEYDRALRRLTAESNEALFRFVEESSIAFEADGIRPDERRAAAQVSVVKRDLLDLRNTFVRRNTDALLDAIDVTEMRGPVTAPQVH